ncbi:MAG: hypothetical protein M1829_002665 [Trizodia sp. TS-e1964]|nr:MAG: hypothetical protein M1829_002665 [Trizodia sp. TS-e1964]
MAASSSRLERLPQEIVEKIFVSSANPHLPSSPAACSRSSRSLLGRRFLDMPLFDAATREITPLCTHGLSGDFSDRCPLEFDYTSLVGPLPGHESVAYPSKQYHARYPDVPHSVFARDIDISPRLLCNFQPTAALPSYPQGRFWKIELLRRVMATFVLDRPYNPLVITSSKEAEAAVQQGFYEAIRASNFDAVLLLSI